MAQQVLGAYIEAQQHLIRPSAPRRLPRLHPYGRFFNLEQIYQDLNRTYFESRVAADITWGRRPPQRPRTSIRFGSYDAKQRLIRIHHLLDQSFVPQYFVESVVFHEMLHQLIPRQRLNGRWSVHPPAFRQAEQRFPYYEQALQWQQRYLAHLLKS
jgi:predicted metal-dependent hydrolase